MAYLRLSERKAAKEAQMRAALAEVKAELAQYGRTHGGWFLLYGSAARGALRFDSDVDLLLDFPEEEESAAWSFAEELCAKYELEPDIRPRRWCSAAFLEHIGPEIEPLG